MSLGICCIYGVIKRFADYYTANRFVVLQQIGRTIDTLHLQQIPKLIVSIHNYIDLDLIKNIQIRSQT